MPRLRSQVRARPGGGPGGIVSYPLERIYQEVAYIAYHFHWAISDILEMEHKERQIWVREISEINMSRCVPNS